MKKRISRISFLILLLTSALSNISYCSDNEGDKVIPAAHILMPAYNASQFIGQAIDSVLAQDYPKVKLLVLDDASTDDTSNFLQQVSCKTLKTQKSILFTSHPENQGVAKARSDLIKWSKHLDPEAYIFWLDADDTYTYPSFIKDVVNQMHRTSADVCLFNFSIIYEDEAQQANAHGLLKDKENLAQILHTILSAPSQAIHPLQIQNILEVTSLGWVKCYGPTVRLPEPACCPFEDFVYMAALLEAHKITALSPEKEPIQYLRRSSSICGQRKSHNFTHDIPIQLMTFMKTIIAFSRESSDYPRKIELAGAFVERKLNQYSSNLKQIIATSSHPEINQETLETYLEKAVMLKSYIKEARSST